MYRKEHGDNQDVTVPLFTTLHSTSESIVILLLNQSIFDADVLLRTVMEGTIKYCYLMTGTVDDPKKEQDKLKQKWSYQALLRSLAKANREYEAQLGTLSTYSLTSHFCHYDWTGVSSRNAQIVEAENPNAIIFDIMHSIRILFNVLSMELFRVAEYMRGDN